MALKIYINEEKQAFLKRGNNDLLSGIQYCRTYALPPIRDAYYSGTNTIITSVKLVEINRMTLEDGEETALSTSVVTYSTDQFKVNQDVIVAGLTKGCVYYLEFTNGENIYKSEPFLVQEYSQKLSADQLFWTADSTLITADQTIITV